MEWHLPWALLPWGADSLSEVLAELHGFFMRYVRCFFDLTFVEMAFKASSLVIVILLSSSQISVELQK